MAARILLLRTPEPAATLYIRNAGMRKGPRRWWRARTQQCVGAEARPPGAGARLGDGGLSPYLHRTRSGRSYAGFRYTIRAILRSCLLPRSSMSGAGSRRDAEGARHRTPYGSNGYRRIPQTGETDRRRGLGPINDGPARCASSCGPTSGARWCRPRGGLARSSAEPTDASHASKWSYLSSV